MSEKWNNWLGNKYVASGLALVAVLGVGFGGYFLGQMKKTEEVLPENRPAGTVPQLPQGWERESSRQFDHWQLDCLKTPQGNQRCSLLLSAVGKQTKRLAFAMMISADNKSQPILVVITPPAVRIPEGVKLTFGSKELPVIPFVGCNGRFCRAVTALNKDTADAISQSNNATAQFTVSTGRSIAYKLQTNGFVEGYAAWQSTVSSKE